MNTASSRMRLVFASTDEARAFRLRAARPVAGAVILRPSSRPCAESASTSPPRTAPRRSPKRSRRAASRATRTTSSGSQARAACAARWPAARRRSCARARRASRATSTSSTRASRPEGCCSTWATRGTSRAPAASTRAALAPRRPRRVHDRVDGPHRRAHARRDGPRAVRVHRLHAPPALADRAHQPAADRPGARRASTTRTRSIPSRTSVTLAWRDDGTLSVDADGRAIVLDADDARADRQGAGWVRAAPDIKARPGNLVTWAVDRVRGMDWFGEESMQYVKAIAFTGARLASSARDAPPRRRQREGDRRGHRLARRRAGTRSFTDPEIGWPPPPMSRSSPRRSPAKASGSCSTATRSSRPSPARPPRSSRRSSAPTSARPETRVYVTLWDPRQIALHMASRHRRARSAGRGRPRRHPARPRGDPPRRRRLQRRLPSDPRRVRDAGRRRPVPSAEAVRRDGPRAARRLHRLRRLARTRATCPTTSSAYRQNLTAIVEHGEFNPWKREWWGGTPKGWQDNIHTTRSGICLVDGGSDPTTHETRSFVGYFFGVDISAEVLATR